MDGMEQRFDGHLWTKPQTTNMSLPCTVQLSHCLGSLECHRVTCQFYLNNKQFNNTFFHGYLDRKICKGYMAQEDRTSITCHYCKKVVSCSATCDCLIYYVIPEEDVMTRLVVHVGVHKHLVQSGTSRVEIEKMRKLVRTVLRVDRGSGPRKVQMMVARQIMVDSLSLNRDSEMRETEFHNFLEELMPLVQNQR